MRKKIKLVMLIPVTVILLALILVGCPDLMGVGSKELFEIYTIWTDEINYEYFENSFKKELPDGSYTKVSISTSEWNELSSDLTSVGRNYWTESEIKNWLIERGFGNDQVDRETIWFTAEIDHGFIALRYGSYVHMILK